MEIQKRWLELAIELQALSQAGLEYSRDRFDLERFERIREISAEMVSLKTDLTPEKVYDLFCNESGYQTPKVDTRAAIIQDGKILLVQESNKTWSLPGGWCDVDQSVMENTIKEAREEAGLDITVDRLAAVLDRKKHNLPVYAYNVCKFFFLCTAVGGEFAKNSETIDSGWFALDELPPLAEEKNNYEQIKLCFDASRDPNWGTVFD